MRRSSLTRLLAPLAVVIAALAGSCTAISTSPTAIAALQFDTLPFPAVVTGDTLRDSLGVVRPLHAIAFNGAGGVIPNAALTYLALDSGLTISSTGIVTAQRRNGLVRVIASSPALQSAAETLSVARRPDSLVVTGLIDTIRYTLPDSAAANVSPPLGLQIATLDTAGGITGTAGWLVSYQVLFHGKSLAITDTTIATLWNSAGLPSLQQRTDAGGNVAPKLRVRSTFLPSAVESLTVVATVRYHGAPVRGSPVTYLIQVRKK